MRVVDEAVPFQFETTEGDASRAGIRGTLVFMLSGYTRPGNPAILSLVFWR